MLSIFKNLFTVCDSLSSLGFDFKHIFIKRRRRLTQPSILQVFCLGTVASNAFTACANANISATPHRPVPSRPDPSFENFITEQKRRKVAAVDQLPLRCSLRPGIISRGAFLRGSRSWAPHESCRKHGCIRVEINCNATICAFLYQVWSELKKVWWTYWQGWVKKSGPWVWWVFVAAVAYYFCLHLPEK